MPWLISMIGVDNGVPVVSLLLRTVLAAVFLLTSDGILSLLNFLSFLSAINFLLMFCSLVKLKITKSVKII